MNNETYKHEKLSIKFSVNIWKIMVSSDIKNLQMYLS